MTFIRDGVNKNRRAAVVVGNRLLVEDAGYLRDKIHVGKLFTAAHLFTSLGSGAVASFLLVTGAVPAHVSFESSATSKGIIRIYEGTTVSSNGTSVPFVNRNRTSPILPVATGFHTPTITLVGSLIHSAVCPGGSGGGATGAIYRGTEEFLLKPQTKHLIQFTNTDGNSQDESMLFNLYEQEAV